MIFYKSKLLLILLLHLIVVINARPIHHTKEAGDNFFSGSGTYFDPKTQGGVDGACGGPRESSKSDIVALNSAQYGPMNKKSKQCGRKVLIKHGEKATVATVQDACPGCQEKSLDMTPAVFNKLANQKQGVIPITWCFVGDKNCN